MSNQELVPQGQSWSRALQPQIKELAKHYDGSQEEREAQALRDLVNNAYERATLNNLTIGGMLLVVKNRKLYARLGYDSMDEFIREERIGGLGRTQCYKLLSVASATPPTALSAPVMNTGVPQVTLTPELVAQIGTERSYALVQAWKGSTPEEREEMIEAATTATPRDFYETVYRKNNEATFSIDGEEVLMWQDGIGTKVAVLITTDPQERALLLDRLNAIPRAKVA